MTKPIAPEVDPEGFESKLRDCSQALQEIANYLRATARHAGPAVDQRRFRHAPPNSGWGVTFYVDATPFCELHPKSREGHVWAKTHGSNSEAVSADGFEGSEQTGWIKIRTMHEAVRFVKWIVRSHDETHARLEPAH